MTVIFWWILRHPIYINNNNWEGSLIKKAGLRNISKTNRREDAGSEEACSEPIQTSVMKLFYGNI